MLRCHNDSVIKYSVDDNANIVVADNLLGYIQIKFVAREDLTADLASYPKFRIQFSRKPMPL